MFSDDKALLDTTALKVNWAVDDVAAAVSELMDRLEAIKDVETAERLSALIRALNTYIKITAEAIHV